MTISVSPKWTKLLLATLGIAMVIASSVAPASAANHPLRAQLNGRFAQLNTRISSSYGQLGGQYRNLQSQSNQIQSQMRATAQANGGYLTRAQQAQFNQQYSQLGQQVSSAQAVGAPSGQWGQNHPRQAQVMSGAAGLNQTLSNSYGNLGGHYTGLEQRNNAINTTAMNEAKANGGYLTTSQQQRLDNREANLQNSINQDSGQ